MKEKKQILRTCVVSKEICEKRIYFVSFVLEHTVIVDLKGKANGRGAYLKKDKDVILLAKKNKALDRKLEVTVPETIYEELLGYLN